MPHYDYLIVGAGMAAEPAVRAIRQVDPNGTIGLVGAELDPPYSRPPLTKGLWKGDPLESIWRQTTGLGVTMHLGRVIQSLDPENHNAIDDQGTVYSFRKCLLATGSRPRRLPLESDRLIYYRTLADYHRLRALSQEHRRFAVIGSGFIGSEIAAALAMNGKEVVLVVREEGLGSRLFPPDLARFLSNYYRQKGVTMLVGAASGLRAQGAELALSIQDPDGGHQQEIMVDAVVAGIGVEPNVELAQAAGLEVTDGVVVDEYLCTSHPDVYAAGDVASFYNPSLGKRLRVEHEDNAKAMGRQAGLNMAGERQPYHYLPFFYSDLFDLGYEAVGEVDSRLEMVADWKEPYREGVVYYLREGRVRGVLLWNVWEQVEAARRLIAEPGPFRPADLSGRLPQGR